MSASPSQTTNPAKRPLEDASSPSRANDQPEAKRPALDKVIKNGHDEEIDIPESNGTSPSPEANGTSKTEEEGEEEEEETNGEKNETKDEQGDTIVPDASETKPVGSSVTGSTTVPALTPSTNTHDETAWIHIRAVISSPEAATIIGKGGENVSNIRKQSGAKCTVSDYQKGAVERILTVSGVVDAAAKVRISSICFHRLHANIF
jgi:heterogeneous nuclear rnp K-like protein 2